MLACLLACLLPGTGDVLAGQMTKRRDTLAWSAPQKLGTHLVQFGGASRRGANNSTPAVAPCGKTLA